MPFAAIVRQLICRHWNSSNFISHQQLLYCFFSLHLFISMFSQWLCFGCLFVSFNRLRDYRCVAVKQRLFCVPLLVLVGSGHWYYDWMWRLAAQGKCSLHWLSSSKDTDFQIIWITVAETLPANSLFVSFYRLFLHSPFTCAVFVCYICKSCLCLTGRSNLGVLAWMGQHQQSQWPAHGPADVSIRYLYIERDLQDTMIAISVISTVLCDQKFLSLMVTSLGQFLFIRLIIVYVQSDISRLFSNWDPHSTVSWKVKVTPRSHTHSHSGGWQRLLSTVPPHCPFLHTSFSFLRIMDRILNNHSTFWGTN